MLIEELAYRCPYCDKIFWRRHAKKQGESHIDKLGPPVYAYSVGFAFMAELGMQGIPVKVQIFELGSDENHCPIYRLKRADTGESLRGWHGEHLIRGELASIHNRKQVLAG